MQAPDRHPFRWPLSIDAVWLVMPVFVVAIRTILQPIPMEDYWWHLAMGRLVDAGTVPSTNMFLYTLPADVPFYDQPWLAQWLMFLIAEHLGHIATVLVHCGLLIGAFVALVALAFRRGGSPVVVGVTGALAYYLSASTLMPRTQMFAYPLFVVLAWALLVLAGDRASTRTRLGVVAGLVLTTAFWANVHGTFVFAPVLTAAVGAATLLEHLRRRERLEKTRALIWAAAVVSVSAATAIAPGGLDNLLYPFSILFATKGHAATVLEWQAPGPATLTGFLFYASLLGSAAVLLARRSKVTLQELALLGPVTVIALGSVRGILWWAMATVIVIGPHLSALRAPTPREEPSGREGAINAGILGAMAIAVLLALPGGPLFRAVDPAALFGDGRLASEDEGAVLSELNPAGMLAQIEALQGHRIFHHQALGGFFEWTLTTRDGPKPVAFIDQRLELIPGDLWDAYFDISRTRPGWEALVEQYEIDAFVVDGSEQELLEKHLSSSPEYHLVAEDRMWRLYARRGVAD